MEDDTNFTLNYRLEAEGNNLQLPLIEQIVNNLGLLLSKTEWISKYNSYIIYDHEPLSPEGFNIWLEIKGEPSLLIFLTYLLDKRLEKINFLENCFKKSSKKFVNNFSLGAQGDV